MVAVFRSDNRLLEAGSNGLTLTCIVHEIILGLTNTPSAQWRTSSGPVISGEDIVVNESSNDDTTAISVLTFSSLHTSHAGYYYCQGTLVSPAVAVVGNIIYTQESLMITVRCKCEVWGIRGMVQSESLYRFFMWDLMGMMQT